MTAHIPCAKCRANLSHPFHDDGTTNETDVPKWVIDNAGPTTQSEEPEPVFEHPVKGTFDEAYKLVCSKAHDYAADEDVYSNFEAIADQVGITVDQVFHVFQVMKMERLRQLAAKGFRPNHETVRDTNLDLMNYSGLRVGYADEVAEGKR